MDYKEKYEQALKTAKLLADNTDDEICKKKIEAIFPELKESEEEKLINKLHECVCRAINNDMLPYEERKYISEQVIPYLENLEKQSESKPTWSNEDEKQARQIKRIVHDAGCAQKLQEQIADWLKSLKDRIRPQLKQEWSKEDYKVFKDIYEDLHSYYTLKANMLVYDTYKKEYEKKWEDAKKWLEEHVVH